MTLSAFAVSKKRLDKIESDRPEVKDSASIDLEWIPYKGRYEHTKTKIFQHAFVLIGVNGLYYTSQGILVILIQRRP